MEWLVGVGVVVGAEQRRGRRIVIAQVLAEAGERLAAGAEQRVGGCCVADLLTTDHVLLVIER